MGTSTLIQEEPRLTEIEQVSLKAYWQVIEKYMHYKSIKRLIGEDYRRVLQHADGLGRWEKFDSDMKSRVQKNYQHIRKSSNVAVMNMAREILEIVKERITEQLNEHNEQVA